MLNAEEDLNIVREALLHYRGMWSVWLELIHTTAAERRLAQLKIALIDQELTKVPSR